VTIHLTTSATAEYPAYWCGTYNPGARRVRNIYGRPQCLECLYAYVKSLEKERDHYLDEMGRARADADSMRRQLHQLKTEAKS